MSIEDQTTEEFIPEFSTQARCIIDSQSLKSKIEIALRLEKNDLVEVKKVIYEGKDKDGNKMKHIIEFDLPEEREELACTLQAGQLRTAIYEYDMWLRSKMKYDDKLTEDQNKVFDECRSNLWNCLTSEGINELG